MKYLPTTIDPDDSDIAITPYMGGEFNVFLSRIPALLLGSVTLATSGSGSYANNPACAIRAGGADLQLVASTELASPMGVCAVVFNIVDDKDEAATLTFTFAPPPRSACQDTSFARGYAVDGTVAGGTGTKVKSITGLKSVSNGGRNVGFRLYQLPEAADYVLVGCTTEKKFTTKSRKPVGIDCGMEADAFTKRGKSGKGELTLDSKFGGMADRLSRFNGAKTTAMLVGIKDGQVTCDRLVFTQYVPGVDVNLPDGEGEAVENAASGKYVDHLFFVAP